jgi:two-component sensor histidine kinase
VHKPAHKGFGSTLVQGSVAGELGGRAEMAFDPHGLSCRLEAPLPAAA